MVKRLLLPALTLSLASTACGEGGTGVAGGLSELELQTTVTAIFSQSVVQTVALPIEIEGGPQAAPVEFTDEVTMTIDCSVSGTVESVIEVNGTVDDETEEAQLDFDVDQVHDDCVETLSGTGIEVEIEGSPRIVGAVAFESDVEGARTVDGRVAGTVRVTTESTSVTCSIQLQFEGSAEPLEPVDYSFHGTFCGGGFQATFTG